MSDSDANGSTMDELDEDHMSEEEALGELRRLIVGPVQAQIEGLQERFDDPGQHAKAVGRVLPQAIVYRSAEDRQLATALLPTVEEVVRFAVKKDVKTFADALFPVIGPAIRKAIAETLRGMLQSLNEILENSFSWQGLQWRLEAIRTRRPFSEIVLLHSVVYRVEQVFLIHRETGLLLQHVDAPQVVLQDADMVSAMLKAIEDFIGDSFMVKEHDSLEAIRVGELTIWVEQGPKAILACVIRGNAPEGLRGLFQETLGNIHLEQSETFESFRGDVSPFEGARPELEACLQAQYRQKAKKFSPALLTVSGVLIALLIGWIAFYIRDQLRWTEFMERLRASPGIVVTHAVKQKGQYLVSGLRDELAEDPKVLLEEARIEPERVVFQWVPFQSLEDRFILKRAVKLLQPPETLELRVENGVLIAEGSALHDWVVKFRRTARNIAGVREYQDKDLVDSGIQQVEELRDFLSKLKAEPGIMVTSVETSNGKFLISGLKDPLARDPMEIIKETKLRADNVVCQWESYLALDPELVLKRAQKVLHPPETVTLALDNGTLIARGAAPHRWITDARKLAPALSGVTHWQEKDLVDVDLEELQSRVAELEKQTVFFLLRTTDFVSGESKKLDILVDNIGRLEMLAQLLNCEIRIQVVGHTDSSGSESKNLELSEARANLVLSMLVSKGIPSAILSTRGAAATQPLQAEKTERGRELNRRVSFRVTTEKCPP